MARTIKTRIRREPLPLWAHPDVVYAYNDWRMIRDCIAGEKEIKLAGPTYVPQLEGMDKQDYEAYLERPVFYNFTARTAGALVGTIFRRQYGVDGIPERFTDRLTNKCTKKSESLDTFFRQVATEIIAMGRHGVLVDLPSSGSVPPKPYFASYKAEDILDWDIDEIDDFEVVTRLVLRERISVADVSTRQKRVRYRLRELILDKGVYRQRVYTVNSTGDTYPSLDSTPEIVTPKVRGKALDFIPFYFFGMLSNTPAIEKSPMLDIALLNISHFRSSAHLEHGRFYTGMPVYYKEVGAGETADYIIGPGVVWETSIGTKPGILEFNGNGLKFLENALDQKEQQASSLGGRMMGVRAAASSESDNSLKLKERNEQVHLLHVTKSMDQGCTTAIKWWLMFAGANDAELKKVEIYFSKDFLFDGIGSREFRAVQSMYKDGILPIDVVYEYLKKAEVIPDWMSVDEFKTLLDAEKQFPNNADVPARREGFADARAQQQKDLNDEQIRLEEEALALEEQAQKDAKVQAAAQLKATKAQAPAAPNPAPGLKPKPAK